MQDQLTAVEKKTDKLLKTQEDMERATFKIDKGHFQVLSVKFRVLFQQFSARQLLPRINLL